MQLVLKLFAPVMLAVTDSLKVYPKVEKFNEVRCKKTKIEIKDLWSNISRSGKDILVYRKINF